MTATDYEKQRRAVREVSQQATGAQTLSISRFCWRAHRFRVGDGRMAPQSNTQGERSRVEEQCGQTKVSEEVDRLRHVDEQSRPAPWGCRVCVGGGIT